MSKDFKSWRSYWDFEQSVRSRRRFVHAPEVDDFLDVVLETGKRRVDFIPKNTVLWRSCLGFETITRTEEDGGEEFEVEEAVAVSPERLIPTRDGASEGRVNPKGIPCIYLSDNQDTALAEVRPWIGATISLGRFELLRDARVIDFSADNGGHSIFLREPPPEKREEAVWRAINRAFSRPVTPSDRHADYVSTQILGELFKAANYDGIVFKSSCSEGHNVALFNIDSVRLLGAALFEAKGLKYEFEQTSNAYSIRDSS